MTITSTTIRLICGLAMLAPIVGCLGEGPTGEQAGRTPGDGVFTEPQSVYSGAPVEHAKYPNGGIFNKAVLTRIARVQAQHDLPEGQRVPSARCCRFHVQRTHFSPALVSDC